MTFDLIVFDLDDTLLDTSRYLIPLASRDSCEAMVNAGLQTTIGDCLAEREAYFRENPRKSVYEHLANHFPAADKFAVLRAGYEAFYARDVVPEAVQLVPGARELLQSLKNRYRLCLLTAGHIPTQKRKIELLQIAGYFNELAYVDPSKDESKELFFKKLAQTREPERLLSVGNRLDTDLAPAKKWQWKTCWVRYGEYKHMQPISTDENADYVIDRLEELITQCHL